MASVDDLASVARPVLRGIDWNALAAKGPDKYGIPSESVFSPEQGYYYDYIRPAGVRAGKVRDTLNLDVTADEAYVHFRDIYTSVKSVSNVAYEAAKNQIPFLSDETAMKVSVETFRSGIAICWFTALYGAELHRTGAMQLSGRFSEEEIVRHAALVTAMFECITLLDELEVLKPIKKSGASGVGAVPLVAVVIVVAVIAIVVIAFAVVSIMEVSQKNAAMKKECEEARVSGDLEVYQTCLDALSAPHETIATQLYKDTIREFAPYIAAITGGVILIAISPFVVSRLSKAQEVGRRRRRERQKKAWKELGY